MTFQIIFYSPLLVTIHVEVIQVVLSQGCLRLDLWLHYIGEHLHRNVAVMAENTYNIPSSVFSCNHLRCLKLFPIFFVFFFDNILIDMLPKFLYK